MSNTPEEPVTEPDRETDPQEPDPPAPLEPGEGDDNPADGPSPV